MIAGQKDDISCRGKAGWPDDCGRIAQNVTRLMEKVAHELEKGGKSSPNVGLHLQFSKSSQK
jgi:hypothetical protein